MIAVPRKDRRPRLERITEAVKNSTGGELPPEVVGQLAEAIDKMVPAGYDLHKLKATTVDIADSLEGVAVADMARILNATMKCLGMVLPKIANSSAVYSTVCDVARRKVEKLHAKLGSKTYLETMNACLEKTPDGASPENVALMLTQCYLLEMERLAAVAVQASKKPADKG